MNNLIQELETKGMIFDERSDINSASDYLTYNVTWSALRNSLKQFNNTIEYNKTISDKIYAGITFYDVIQAGLLDYYYNEMISSLLNEFEHLFKNYFIEVYNSLDDSKKAVIIKFINTKHNEDVFINDSKEINDIYDLFNFITFTEVIDIFNHLLFKEQTLLPYQVPQSFAVFFKEVINNRGLTLFMDNESNQQYNDVIENFNFFDHEQIKYLEVNPFNNSCYLAVQLIKLTNLLQSRSTSLAKRRSYTAKNLTANLEKCHVSLSKSNLFDTWVNSHFEIIEKTIKETYEI